LCPNKTIESFETLQEQFAIYVLIVSIRKFAIKHKHVRAARLLRLMLYIQRILRLLTNYKFNVMHVFNQLPDKEYLLGASFWLLLLRVANFYYLI